MKITWINLAPGAPADERGYWRSLEGRFEISPRYRNTVYPDSYKVTDRMAGNQPREVCCDTVRDCKDWARIRITNEREKDTI